MEQKTRFDKILILDFGSQYTQLIARRVRECQIYSEIHSYDMDVQKVRSFAPKGIILSGSPASVYEKNENFINKMIMLLLFLKVVRWIILKLQPLNLIKLLTVLLYMVIK